MAAADAPPLAPSVFPGLMSWQSVVKQKVEELVRDPTLGAIRTTRRLRQTMQDLRTWLVEKGYFRIDNIRIVSTRLVSSSC